MKRKSSSTIVIILLSLALAFLLFKHYWPKKPDTARIVSVDSARAQTGRYLSLLDTARRPNAARINSFFYSAESFSKKNIEAILSQSGCDGIRIYHAINRNGRSTLIIVGIKGNEDLLPDTANAINRNRAAVYDENYNIIDAEDENLRCKDNCDLNGLGQTQQ